MAGYDFWHLHLDFLPRSFRHTKLFSFEDGEVFAIYIPDWWQVRADLTLKDASGGTVLHAAALMGLLGEKYLFCWQLAQLAYLCCNFKAFHIV